ncbi:MAG: T9SS type A sorting domain-containing protein [Saprospiraceae bacterium]|nr:T9SS type A sorting domain-containing protein [Saprospiraceae bacterium]MCB9324615.1 T9SS type A sorting domain-containing protein [Lewinellaceae bacterium]
MKISGISLMTILSIAFFLSSTVFTHGQAPKLCPEDGVAGDEFGVFVSLSGDFALIGASAARVEEKTCGAAYIFKHEPDGWVQRAKFFPDTPDEDDLFGKILKLDGDHALVTSYNDDDMGENAGAAFIYQRTGDDWTLQSKLFALDAEAFDNFGVAADIYGDRAIIGAFGDDDNGFFSGSAYIFVRQNEQWIQEVKLLPSDGAAFDKFGRSVAISEDYAVICGVLDDDNGEESGSVYVFRRNGNTWTEEAKLTPDDGATGDRFGRSISIAGDYVAISAALKDEHGLDSGSAYVFKRVDGQWIQQSKLVPDDLGVGDLMGYCITSNEDFVAISAHLNDEQGADAGAFYLFHRNGEQWSEAAKITADHPEALDYFGICVDISAGQLICGAPLDQSDEGIECGVAYIYDLQQYLSTEDIGANSFSIFPNPVHDILFFKENKIPDGTVVAVYNVAGELVFKKILTGQSVPVSGLSPGTYFLELTTKEGRSRGKFIVD